MFITNCGCKGTEYYPKVCRFAEILHKLIVGIGSLLLKNKE